MEQHEELYGVIDSFSSLAERMGKKVVVKSEEDATIEDMHEVDCVVSLGGDHTFLRASALIWDRRTPILGINTNKDVYSGVLNPHFIDYESREEQAGKILETMEDDHSTSYEKRTRFLYERTRERKEQEEQR